MSSSYPCPACSGTRVDVFFEQDAVPTHSCLLLATAEEARTFPRGSLRLGFCRSCGFIFNVAFDPSHSAYSSTYEETQGFSPRFRAFLSELAQRWVDRYDIRGKDVLEIGCGKGEFLAAMCELGENRGTGIDPSYVPERNPAGEAVNLTFIRDLYSERYVHLSADAVVCRHTLEHIAPVGEFLRLVRQGIGDRDDVVVLFELPDVLRVLREVAFWDVYYEHCSYFSLGSLARLFRSCGFDPLDLSLDFDDQYLLIEARSQSGPPAAPLALEDDMAELSEAVEHFAVEYTSTVAKWRETLGRVADQGRRAVIWGAGSKGVSYLSALGPESGIQYAVDINPFKEGMYLAGSGEQIVAPEFLKAYRPDVVVVMNAIYQDEIQVMLDGMCLDAEVLAV